MKVPLEILDNVIANREGGLVQLRVMRAAVDREFARQIRKNTELVRDLKRQRREAKRGQR